MPGKTLLVFTPDGQKSDVAVAVASVFAVRGFTHIALISPDGERLSKDEDQVLDAIQERGYSCQTKTVTSSLDSEDSAKKVLDEVSGWGDLEAVFWDGTSGGEESWGSTLSALGQEAIPELSKGAGQEGRSPSILVAAQSLPSEQALKEKSAGKVHVALIQSGEKSSEQIADSAWESYKQSK